MARRKSTFGGPLDLILSLPWWVNVLLAVVAYFGFRYLAGMQFNLPKNLGWVSGLAVKQFIKGTALVFQYLVPFVFIIGAIGSSSTGRRTPFDMTNERREPWKGIPEGDFSSAPREPSLPAMPWIKTCVALSTRILIVVYMRVLP